MSKLSDRDLKVIYVVLMFVVAALAYFIGVKPNMEKRAEIREETHQLETKLSELRAKEANVKNIQDETDAMNESITKKCAEFPRSTNTQAAYKMVDDLMKTSKIEVSSIAVSMNDIFFAGSGDVAEVIAAQEAAQEASGDAAAQDTTQDEQTEEGTEQIQDTSIQLENLIGYRSAITLSFEGSAKQVQDAVEFIKASSAEKHRMTLGNISLAFDSGTGGLTGSMIIYMYALEGNGGEVLDGNVGDMPHGVDNIFGTFD